MSFNMNDITAVEVPDCPEKDKRFLTFFGNEYSGPNSLQYVPMSRVVRTVNGVLQGDKPRSMNQRIVDDVRVHAASGQGSPYLATARVVKYLVSLKKWEIVYEGKEKEVQQVEPEVPKAMLAHDGTWRVVPTKGFQKGPREWRLSIAFVDRNNEPRATQINGKTKLDIVKTLFESSFVSWMNDYVLTLPFADPADIPAAPAPVVERVYTQAELDAVPPLDPREWNKMPAEESKRRWAFEPLFREAHRKMEALDKLRQQREAERAARETEENDAKRLREEFIKKDADEARKGHGVGTIL